MTFSSLTFLFLFLPVSVAAFYLIPARFRTARKIVLLALSVLFYAWGDASLLPVLLLSVCFNYFSGVQISALKEKNNLSAARFVMISAVAVNAGALAFFKYAGVAFPLGVSFYTFSAISYILDLYMDRAEADKNFLNAAFYMLFFPKVISGPIVEYKDMQEQIREMKAASREEFCGGLYLFLIGLFKKVLIADPVGITFDRLQASSQVSAGTAWLTLIFYSLQLYFDFSGYSDMAIGLARTFGFSFEMNFDCPYTSSSPTEFWRRWHISLGRWFRDYVYIPLGGNRCSRSRQLLNLSVVWILTGLWHGNTLPFLFWGIYHGAFVILDKFCLKGFHEKAPKAFQVFLTTLMAFFGWSFFFNPTLADWGTFAGRLIGIGAAGAIDGTFLYNLRTNAILLVIAFIGCGPWIRRLHEKFIYREKGSAAFWASAAVHAVLFVFTIGNMVGSTYQTFLYFRF